jgi:TIR domain-containing protein/pentapeptide repeat protein
MADREHVDILMQGVEAWNQWRRKHPETRPDLSSADLSLAKLHKVDFHGTNLIRANLTSTNLIGAVLDQANLSRACLNGATFYRASLTRATLVGASLHEASLIDADLTRTNLTRADFSYAFVGLTNFGGVDLSTVQGLDTVDHRWPSIIGIDTIYLSQGNLPMVFLQGAGVPDTLIDYIRTLIHHPIQYYSLFISYSSKDEALARRLHTDLQANGVRCWFAPEDLKIGNKFRQRIDEAIHQQDKLLLLLSEYSIESLWVENEVEAALEKEDQQQREVLFPIRLDDAVMQTSQAWTATLRRTRHIGDFTNWTDLQAYQIAFDRLLADLRKTNEPAS